MKVPVLIIAFNRPDLFSTLLKKVSSMNPPKIYIAIDGPRIDKLGERDQVNQVISVANEYSKIGRIIIKINDKNLGCAVGVSSAITWFFENEDKGIILEDDCYPNDSFFPFCEELLFKYENDERIGMISGDNFFFSQFKVPSSYYFSKYFHIWGWASWRRAWSGYRLRSENNSELQETLKRNFCNKIERNFWLKQIGDSFSGIIDTWDYQWVYHNFKKNRLSIMPSVNLISNRGFGEFATHTVDSESILNSLKIDDLRFPLKHPTKVRTSVFTEFFSRRLMYQLPFFERLFYFIFRKIIFLFSKIGAKNEVN